MLVAATEYALAVNYRQVMKALKSAGTAQNRKIYARHGVLEPMFGVSTANLTKIKKDALRLPGPSPATRSTPMSSRSSCGRAAITTRARWPRRWQIRNR